MTNLFIAGDSTAAQKGGEARPETGWGEKIGLFLTPELLVRNYAQNGRSTKSFIAEKRLAQIQQEIQPGDFLLIQFGHNDQKNDPAVGTDPWTDYQANLKEFIAVAQQAAAFPILLTPVTRRSYLPNGVLDPQTLGDYPTAMMEIATEMAIPLVDTFGLTQYFYRNLTPDQTQKLHLHLPAQAHPNYLAGIADDTHFNDYGATMIAQLIAAELAALEPHPIQQYIR